jgi:hypothetical protein
MPINLVLVTHHSHHRSAHKESIVLGVFANVMAHGLPIHRSAFSAGGDIGPVLPTIYLSWLGLGRGEGILLLLACFEALFWRQSSWLKASLFFVFYFLVLFQLIVR